jgi:hypothetical protein
VTLSPGEQIIEPYFMFRLNFAHVRIHLHQSLR